MKNHDIPFDIPFDETGAIRLAVKTDVKKGELKKPKDTEYQQELINICLNCEKKKCRGCPNDKRFNKQRTLNDEELV